MASAGGDAGAKGSFKPPPRFANVDDSTSERRLERRLGGAPSLERGGAMAKSRPTVASHTVVASRPADDQPGRLGGDHRVDSGEFGESAQSIGHGEIGRASCREGARSTWVGGVRSRVS